MSLLATHQLCLKRGNYQICQQLDLSLQAGETLLITGDNGAGKTSLLRVLSGLSEAGQGTIKYHEAITGNDILYIGHRNGLRSELTPFENLKFYVQMRDQENAANDQSITDALNYFGLRAWTNSLCGQLSEGQRQRVALSRLLTESAKLWILDEPSASLDSAGLALFNELLGKQLSQNGAAIIATHRQISPSQGQIKRLNLPC